MASGFMPLGDFDVTYVNGEVVRATSNFRGLIEVERRWPGTEEAPGLEAIALAMWFYLGEPLDNFDAWLSTVHSIDGVAQDVAPEDAPPVPTGPAVGVD